MRSPQPTSSIEPIERNALKPTCSRRLQSRMAVQIAPLWLTSATLPGRAMALAKVAFNPLIGLMTPRQLGPIIRMRPRRASSSTWRSRSAPAFPDSLKPADIMMAPFTPAATQSRTTPGTVTGRCHDHREVHLIRHGGDIGIRADAEHAAAFRVHRIHGSTKRAVDQIPQRWFARRWLLSRSRQSPRRSEGKRKHPEADGAGRGCRAQIHCRVGSL